MKVFFTIVFVVVMSLALVTCASAASVVSVDSLQSGTYKAKPTTEGDIALNIISAGTLIDKWKLGAEYGTGNLKIKNNGPSFDVGIWSVKGGYRFVDATATKVDGIIALLNINSKTTGMSSELNSNMVGLDFTQYFSEKAFLSATYVTGISSSYKFNAIQDTNPTASLLRVKVSYLFTENIGGALSYNDLNYSAKLSSKTTDYSLNGYSFGVFYKF